MHQHGAWAGRELMGLRVLAIAVIITILSIAVVSVVCGKENQNSDDESEIIKVLNQVIKNQETIMKDLRYIKNKV